MQPVDFDTPLITILGDLILVPGTLSQSQCEYSAVELPLYHGDVATGAWVVRLEIPGMGLVGNLFKANFRESELTTCTAWFEASNKA